MTQQLAQDTSRRRWNLWIAGLIVFWAAELLIVQEMTSLPTDMLSVAVMMKYTARRLVLNVAATIFLVSVLNRAALYTAFGLWFVSANALAVYSKYFGQPLSWFVLCNQWREGAEVADFAVTKISWAAFLLLLAGFVLKVVLLERARRSVPERPTAQRLAWSAAVAYVVFAYWLAGYHKPFPKLRFASPEYAYGYTVAWATEAMFDEQKLLTMALKAAEEKSDQLGGHEPLLDLGERIAIVQVESLDFDVLDHQINGQWVTPFLRDLRSRAMFYAVEPIHRTGSSDADFTLLTGSKANGRIVAYKLTAYPYRDTLPQAAKEKGYDCVAFHGVTGKFFNRRPAYEKMGFSRLCFAEELRELGCPLKQGAIEDTDVLQLSAKWMREAERPTIHFIITFTSHGPFNRLAPEQCAFYPHPEDQTQAYLNSMHYVDGALQDYIEALPDDTTVVMYGDHQSGVEGYQPEPLQKKEKIPWLIYTKGKNLAPRQQTRSTIAQSGKLGQLDLATYLHRSFKTPSPLSLPKYVADKPLATTRVK